jgi:hypothetical protein
MYHCRVLLQRATVRLGYVQKRGETHQLMMLLQRAVARRHYLLKWSLALPRALSLSTCVRACMRVFLSLMVSI